LGKVSLSAFAFRQDVIVWNLVVKPSNYDENL